MSHSIITVALLISARLHLCTWQVELARVGNVDMSALESEVSVGVPRRQSHTASGRQLDLRTLNAHIRHEDVTWPSNSHARRVVWTLLGEAIALNVCPAEAATQQVCNVVLKSAHVHAVDKSYPLHMRQKPPW
jgi:hypothetical protein